MDICFHLFNQGNYQLGSNFPAEFQFYMKYLLALNAFHLDGQHGTKKGAFIDSLLRVSRLTRPLTSRPQS
jgi:hypothetical protein